MTATTERNGSSPAAASDAAAVGAAEEWHPEQRIEQVTLENGIVLRLKPVPPLLISDASRRVVRPEPPIVTIEAKGTQEANPNDPDYIAALQRYVLEREEAALTVALIVGTEVVSVPDGMYGPEADGWIELIEAAYLADPFGAATIRREPEKARYLDWLRYYALPSDDDIVRVSTILTSSTSVSEEEVRAAVDAFRSRTQRLRNLGNSIGRSPEDRDHSPPEAAGNGERVGGAGGGEVQPDPVAGLVDAPAR